MAEVFATKNGNWSDVTVWNTGALPLADDDVFADGKTVTIDQAITVLSIRTTQRSGGLAGGGFSMTTAFDCLADIIAGTTTCLNYSANGANWTGNATGGDATNAFGAQNTGSGIFNLIGNATGGSAGGTNGVRNVSTGIFNLTGNATGGSLSSVHGAINTFTGTFNLTGNATGGSALNTFGAINSSTGTFNLIGNATGGSGSSAHGAINTSTGTFNLTGNMIGGSVSTSFGAQNQSTGTFITTTAMGSSIVNVLAVGLSGLSQGGTTVVKNIVFGSAGQTPISGFIKFDNGNENTATVLKQDNTQVALIDLANLPNELPTDSDVRQGTVFNSNNKVGTLSVPDPSNVRKDIPTDNTAGTAELTGEDILQALNDSTLPLAVRLKNVTTNESVGSLLSGL